MRTPNTHATYIDLTNEEPSTPIQPAKIIPATTIVDLTEDNTKQVPIRFRSISSGRGSNARRHATQIHGSIKNNDKNIGSFGTAGRPSPRWSPAIRGPSKEARENVSSSPVIPTISHPFLGREEVAAVIIPKTSGSQNISADLSVAGLLGRLDSEELVEHQIPNVNPTHLVASEMSDDEHLHPDLTLLNMAIFEDILEKHIRELREDHEYFVKDRLARARRAYDKAPTSPFIQSDSPFADIQCIKTSSISITDSLGLRVGKLQQQVIKSTKPGAEKLTAPCIPYTPERDLIPPYEGYISTKRNVLVEDELHRAFIPYTGDDTWIEPDYADMETLIGRNKEKYNRLNVLCEKAKAHGPYAERYLNEIGCDFNDVLYYLLHDIKPKSAAIPEELPQHLIPDWLNREEYVKEDYYEDSDDSESSEPRKEDSEKMPLKQWRTVFEGLPKTSNSRRIAVAGLACAAFLKVTGFSLWHVAKRQGNATDIVNEDINLQDFEEHLLGAQSSSKEAKENSSGLSTYISLGCLVCFAHECPGHGEYCEEDDAKNVRLKVNANPLSPLVPIGRRYSDDDRNFTVSSVIKVSTGMEDDGTITGSDPTKKDGFREDELCSDLCFWKKSNRERSLSSWLPNEVELLETLLPTYIGLRRAACILAVAIAKPCAEIFLKMCKAPLPSASAKIRTHSQTLSLRPAPKRSSEYWQQNSITWRHDMRPPFRPCNHSGPCNAAADCSCYDDEVTCEKSCLCAENCTRRYQGCLCVAKGRVCWNNDLCPCYRLDRECDPDTCKTCGAHEVLDPVNRYREDISKGKCTNVYVQRGVPRRTLMGHSALLASGNMSGWGLYIGEAVKAGEYLGEYVGEIISKEESERRGLIYNKRNLSYLFNLNRDQVLDSTRVGNKFRYINHQTPPYANCRAKILLCNTVQRIGMFAVRNLEIGEELLFDYGDEFTSRFDLIELDENAKPRMERSKGAAGKKSVAAGKAVKVQPATAKKTGARPGRPRKNIQIVKPAEPHIAFLDTDEEVSSEKGGGTAIRKPEDKKGNKRKRATLDRPANKGLDASQDALLSDDNGSLDLMESSAESLYESEDAEEELEVLKSMEARQGEYNNPQKRGWITRKANLVRYETEEELEVVRPRMRLGRGDAQKQGWVTRKANLARSNKPRRR